MHTHIDRSVKGVCLSVLAHATARLLLRTKHSLSLAEIHTTNKQTNNLTKYVRGEKKKTSATKTKTYTTHKNYVKYDFYILTTKETKAEESVRG